MGSAGRVSPRGRDGGATARRHAARLAVRRLSLDWAGARERLASPLFAPLAPAIARLPADGWPTHEALSAAAVGIRTSRGSPVRFVPPREPGEGERRHYELRIAQTGEVETRPGNWHDLFNALVWITFPRAKAALNAQHAAILAAGGAAEARRRSPERDALTLFDEGGVVVASSSAELARLIPEFRWKQLFWARRAELAAHMRFLVFGHACYEQALAPYVGMVAKTVCLPVDEAFFRLSPAAQVVELDARLGEHFADRARFPSPRAMDPMPVLGVPGWYPETACEAFYDDERYFRSRPRRGGTAVEGR